MPSKPMRKIVSVGLVATMIVIGVPVGALAAGPVAAKRQTQPTGTIQGDAKGANGEKLTQTKVRIRNSQTGQIAADLTTDAAGTFVGAVPAGSYVVEIVGANGAVIGLSPVLAVAAGQTATISVTASAVAAVGAAAAGATGGGLSIFGLGTITSIAVLGGAATATVFGIKAATNDASPSR
jgi:hypothetical protein